MFKNIINSSKQKTTNKQLSEDRDATVTNMEEECAQQKQTNKLLLAAPKSAPNHLLNSDTMSNASSSSSRFKFGRKSKKRLSAMMDRLHLRKNRSSPSGLGAVVSSVMQSDQFSRINRHNGSIDSESVYTEEDLSDLSDCRPHLSRQANQAQDDDCNSNGFNSDSEYELASEDLFEDALPVAKKDEVVGGAVAQQQQGSGQQSSGYFNLTKDNELLPEEQCDIPTFLHTKTCDPVLIEQTRILLKERYLKNPDSFYDDDYKRMLNDDWTVTRFLLRRRLDPKRTAKLMEECGRFRIQYKMSEVKLWEFPREFHRAGGLFKYAPDRVGNYTLFMRVKMYRRVPEISDVFKAFILCVLEECDRANDGRGTAIIFDLSGCGLQNVDLGFLSWLLSSFRNYCPKGVSYILVYNLPWILNATCKMAMTWMSASNRRALRFVHGDEIENFIARENLPDYLGGTCKINYKTVPEGSLPAIDVCDKLDMTREQALKIKELFKEYLGDDEEEDDDCVKTAAATNRDRIADDSTSGKFLSLDSINETNTIETITSDTIAASATTTAAAELVSRASKFIA